MLKAFGPVQLYEVIVPDPVAPAAVSVKPLPRQKEAKEGVILVTVGLAFTVTTTLELQPPETIYDILAVPAVPPVVMFPDEDDATVATEGLLLLHVPVVTVFDNVVEPPRHIAIMPVLEGGSTQRLHCNTVFALGAPEQEVE